MNKSRSFTIQDKQGVTCVTAEIPAEDWKAILKFLEQSNKILCEVSGTYFGHFRVSWKQGETPKYESHEMTSRDLAVVLHLLRPFQLENSDTSFNKTVNRIKRSIHEGTAKDEDREWAMRFLDHFKDKYNGKIASYYLSIVDPDGTIRERIDEKILNVWLNAYEYHHEEEKQRRIEAIEKVIPRGQLRVTLQGMLLDKVNAICALRDLLKGASP